MCLDKGLEAVARAFVDSQISDIARTKTGCGVVKLNDPSLSHELVEAVSQMFRMIAGFGFSGFGRAIVGGKNVEIQVTDLPTGAIMVRVTPVQGGYSDGTFFCGDLPS